MKTKESLIKYAFIISLVLLLALSAFFLIYGWVGGHFDSMDTLKAYIASFGAWGPIVLTLIQVLQVIIPVLPGFLGCFVGGGLFGWFVGFLVNYIGISVGSIIAYYLAKKYGVKLVNKMLPLEKYEKRIEKINQSKSYSVVLFLAIFLPLAPDDFFCYFSGLINMEPKRYITIVLTAKPWCILLYSLLSENILIYLASLFL